MGLILEEDSFEQDAIVTNINTMLSGMIKDEWEAVDGYNSSIEALKQMGASEHMLDVLNEIKSEEYIHIGQLEDLLKDISPEANKLEDGAEENAEMADELPDAKAEIDPVQEGLLPDEVFNAIAAHPHIKSIGVAGDMEAPHFEFDMDNKVYTEVKEPRHLGHFAIKDYPQDDADDVAAIVSGLISDGSFREVSNEEFLALQEGANK